MHKVRNLWDRINQSLRVIAAEDGIGFEVGALGLGVVKGHAVRREDVEKVCGPGDAVKSIGRCLEIELHLFPVTKSKGD